MRAITIQYNTIHIHTQKKNGMINAFKSITFFESVFKKNGAGQECGMGRQAIPVDCRLYKKSRQVRCGRARGG